MCSSCGRDLGEGEWKACPGCGADLAGRQAAGLPNGTMPAAAPEARVSTTPAANAYQPTVGMPYQRYPQAQYQPGAGNYPQGYEAAVPGYPPGYATAADRPGGSVLLGLLTLLAGGLVAGSTFLQWVTSPAGASVNLTGWFVMQGGFEVFGGGFELVIAEQGTIFFTGFFSLLLGALILLGGVVTLIRRRPGGILTLLFALAASVVSTVNITMVFAKMQGSAPGVGLWMFALAALAALALGIISLSSAS